MSVGAALLWTLMIGATAAGAYRLELAVERAENELARLNAALVASREQIHVLEAEWAYLTRPEHLARLARRHLELVPMTAAHLASLEALRPTAAERLAGLDPESAP